MWIHIIAGEPPAICGTLCLTSVVLLFAYYFIRFAHYGISLLPSLVSCCALWVLRDLPTTSVASMNRAIHSIAHVWNHNWYLTILCEFQLRFRKCSIQFELARTWTCEERQERKKWSAIATAHRYTRAAIVQLLDFLSTRKSIESVCYVVWVSRH